MASLKDLTKSVLADLSAHIEKIVADAHAAGRAGALAEVRGLLGGTVAASDAPAAPAAEAAAPRRRRGRPAGSKSAKPAKADKPAKAEKAEKKAKKAPKAAKKSSGRKNPWAAMTDEQRLARVNAIRVGRGLPPKTSL
jgi:hypothetical protein